MKKFLLSLLVIIVVAVAIVLALASTKPNTYSMMTSVSITAKPEKVFAIINDLNYWTKWSPWEAMEPDMKRALSGPAKGVGQAYEWEGKKVGKGRITITESVPSSKVVMKNEWLSPMQMSNMNEYAITYDGKATTVTWTMSGPNTFPQKIMQVFMDMGKAMKPAFEEGLAKLKALSEKQP